MPTAKNEVSCFDTALIIKTLLPKISSDTLRAALMEQRCWHQTTVDITVFNIEDVKRPKNIGGLNKHRKEADWG
jgi:hypothetical protein